LRVARPRRGRRPRSKVDPAGGRSRRPARRAHRGVVLAKLASYPNRRPSFEEVKSVKEREHRRYAHEAAVTCHVAGKRFEGRTRNVSRGGLCADLADKIALGTDLMVDLKLVFEDEAQSDALRLPARVVWCTTVDATHQIGLVFRPLSAEIA